MQNYGVPDQLGLEMRDKRLLKKEKHVISEQVSAHKSAIQPLKDLPNPIKKGPLFPCIGATFGKIC